MSAPISVNLHAQGVLVFPIRRLPSTSPTLSKIVQTDRGRISLALQSASIRAIKTPT
jgi:hypothetical protein